MFRQHIGAAGTVSGQTLSADCLAGEVATGGGVFIVSGAGAIQDSYPVGVNGTPVPDGVTPVAWKGTVNFTSGGAFVPTGGSFEVYVVCAPA